MKKVVRRDVIGNSKSVYLMGIGGCGMGGLAHVLNAMGLRVAGSDARASRMTEQLQEQGIQINIGHSGDMISDFDMVIYSSAIRQDNEEFRMARKLGKKIFHRAEVLSALMNRAETSIGITGTHGKTTTSWMIANALAYAKKKPMCLVGGESLNFGVNAIAGDPNLWVAEVDESDQTHEYFAPHYTIVTNLEVDHVDHYGSMNRLKQSFRRFLSRLDHPGLVVYPYEDSILKSMCDQLKNPRVSFGLNERADYSARDIVQEQFQTEFDLYEYGVFAARVRLRVPGKHNVLNALSCIALLTHLGMDFEQVVRSLEEFEGTKRRLETKFRGENVWVIDDYAHHPTEVRAIIASLKTLGLPLCCIFQPHRFSRTQYFYKDFARAFNGVDRLILTDVYGAGETNANNVDVRMIYDELIKICSFPVHIIKRPQLMNYLWGMKREGVFAFVGAGDIGGVADEFANRFKNFVAA